MAAIMTKRATVTVGSTTYQTRDTSVEPGGLVAVNPSRSDQGTVFYQQEYMLSTVTTTIIHSSETDILELRRGLSNATINIEFDSGANYQVAGAVVDGDVTLSDGAITVTFKGADLKKA